MTPTFTPHAMKAPEKSAAVAGCGTVAEVSCDSCFFGVSDLCSLPKEEACPTFRPDWMVTVRAAARAR